LGRDWRKRGIGDTFGQLFETFESDIKGVRVSELCRVVLNGDVEDLPMSVDRPFQEGNYVHDTHCGAEFERQAVAEIE
jgi:hypothetical protein